MRPLDPRVLPHLAPARRSLSVAMAGTLAGGLLTVGQAFAVGSLIVGVVADPGGTAWHVAAAWLAVVVALRAVCGYAVDTGSARAAGQVSTVLRRRLMAAAARTDATALSRHRTGELTLLATRGTSAVEPYLTRYLPSLAAAAVLPVATLAAILWLDWLSGLIVLLTLPLLPVFAILIGMSTRDRADRQWRRLAMLSGHFLDVVRGLPTLVAHRRAGAQAATIRAVTDRYRRATTETLRLAFASAVVLELVATLSVALVAVSVGLRLAAGSLDFRTALVVLLLAPEAYWPIRRMGAEFHAAAEGAACFEAASAFLAATPPPAPLPSVRLAGAIEIDDLCAGYDGRTVLAGLSATLPSPGLTAVVGPSGCGKSTLLAVLTGELAPSSGAVRVGGVDLATVDPDSWRAQLAWSSQRPWLTAGTIADNIRFGRPDATDAEIWQALERVALDLTVAALPLGLDTPLGEDGVGLSAGQQARVALARVVVARRPYVFLDEPTAHLDEETEAVFLDTLAWLARRSTVVVVAHRETVVLRADRVLALPETATAGVVRDETVNDTPVAVTVSSRTTPALPTPVTKRGRFGERAGIVLGALSVGSGVALTATAAWLIARASTQPPVLTLMVAIVGVRAFGLARPVLRYAERLVSHDAALRVLADRRAQVYDALVPLVPARLGVRRGDLLTSIVDDVDAFVDERLRVRQPLWTAGLVAAAATVTAALVTPVAGAVVAAVALSAVVGAGLARTLAAKAEANFISHRAALSTQVEEVVHRARQLALWQATDRALERLDTTSAALATDSMRSARGLALGRASVVLATGLGPAAIAALVPAGATSPALLALLVLLPLALADALLPAVDAGALSVRTRAARQRLEALKATTPAVTDPALPVPLPAATAVEIERVTAGWDDRDAVYDVSLDLPPARWVGVVGPSGSGKSTLAALLLRFLDPHHGAVALGGADLRALTLDDVRRTVGLVDDDPYVFASTLVENVRLARPDATDDEVERAIRGAHLGDWLDRLPDGLHTRLGEGNADVSGGERARIGIARALLADRPVLVLDEPTAHLDSATARAVTDDVLAVTESRSVLWITHGTIGLDRMDAVLRLGDEAQRGAGTAASRRAGAP